MVEAIKSIRIRLDGYSKLCKDALPQSRQVQNATDELLLGKAWLGKALGEAGIISPYPNDGERKGIKDIERTAETANALVMNDLWTGESGFESKNAVERVDWLRQAIGDTVKSMKALELISTLVHNNIVTHLSEARFWLGFELERQREEAHETHQG